MLDPSWELGSALRSGICCPDRVGDNGSETARLGALLGADRSGYGFRNEVEGGGRRTGRRLTRKTEN
jgi:hypothetical protein